MIKFKESLNQEKITHQEVKNYVTIIWYTCASSYKPHGSNTTLFFGINMELRFKGDKKAQVSVVALKRKLEFNALSMSLYEDKVSLEN